MRKEIITALFFLAFVVLSTQGQTMSCQKIFNFVTQNYDSKDSVNCYTSSMLTKALYYEVDNMGFVVAYIKSNDFDVYGKPYIFCGISRMRWINFKSEGMYGSWGKSFHAYIRDYTCDCY